MFSQRFGLPVHVTRHAAERMAERYINQDQLLNLLEHGTIRSKDEFRMWIAKAFPGRDDNLVCAAVIIEDRLVVKTVMHHFQWEP